MLKAGSITCSVYRFSHGYRIGRCKRLGRITPQASLSDKLLHASASVVLCTCMQALLATCMPHVQGVSSREWRPSQQLRRCRQAQQAVLSWPVSVAAWMKAASARYTDHLELADLLNLPAHVTPA